LRPRHDFVPYEIQYEIQMVIECKINVA
jgi:hypothetical protein